MNEPLFTEASPRLTLAARAASDLMTPSPVSLREGASVQEAVALLTDRGFSAAPVIDEAGRPVGVLSRADIVVHHRESGWQRSVPDYYEGESPDAGCGGACPTGFQVARPDLTRVRDIMTPVVFAVAPDASARRVVEDMVALKVHRLFVVGTDGVLTGVISALDVLKHLHPEQPPGPNPPPALPNSMPGTSCSERG
jgi:CBS domain-containing protein